jgi:hypothetical protein
MVRALGGRAARTAALVALATAAGCVPGWTVGFAGTGAVGYAGDGGPANAALIDTPADIAVVPGDGFVFVDGHNCVIRRVDRHGVISTVAGRAGQCGDDGDGGPALDASLNPIMVSGPRELTEGLIARQADGDIYLDDRVNGRIRRIGTDGTIDTVLDYGLALVWLATDDAGQVLFNAYTSQSGQPFDGIYRLEEDGSATLLLANVDRFGLAVGPDGSWYTTRVASSTSGFATSILRRSPTGQESLVVTVTGVTFADLDVDAAGTVYATHGNTVVTAEPGGTFDTIAGNGSPDPANGRQGGIGTDLALTPVGIEVTPGGGFLISSGHVVYRLWLPDPAGPR